MNHDLPGAPLRPRTSLVLTLLRACFGRAAMHRSWPRLLALAGVLVLLGVTACHAPHHKHEEIGVFAVTTPLRQDTALTREYVAQVQAIQHIEVRAQERGYLTGIYVDEGQRIEEGTKMFQVMPLIYRADLHRAEAEADMASIEFKNTKMLADKDIVSPAELALAGAKLNRAKAELELAQTHMRLTEIRAPFTGLMDRFVVRLGSLVEEGDLLTTLSDNRTLWIYFNVPEAEYLDYKADPEQTTVVQFKMANNRLFDQPGRVETIEADFDNTTGNIAFRATFPNPTGLLRHGETGNVIVTSQYANAQLIPQKATFEILDRRYVFVVDDEGIVHSRPIAVAAELPHAFIVESGLEDSDHILLEGLRKVQDGTHIEVKFEEPAEVFAHLDLHAE
ncbi:efflux RND transporter periplasmic adaptor subunit [Nannocystis sp. bb15-2]|uniref:Efflux RND transporter periplasmic adaptor subunit n=2 Tax=Nannocystis bainbridge TaxID=2995303 RepID=A0ABT5ECB7_9BACT|nr:efflux RND transporter periplasmic adaptor subunit [Nannocystis bainbridge]MDC0723520.1 efflux RND transporter periplasmic adaptor subunit [Nannocystis bainbridge]